MWTGWIISLNNKLSYGVKKQKPKYTLFIRNILKNGGGKLKIKRWAKRCQTNANKRKAGMTILISDKVELKIKSTKQNKEEHCVIIKDNYEEETIIIKLQVL